MWVGNPHVKICGLCPSTPYKLTYLVVSRRLSNNDISLECGQENLFNVVMQSPVRVRWNSMEYLSNTECYVAL